MGSNNTQHDSKESWALISEYEYQRLRDIEKAVREFDKRFILGSFLNWENGQGVAIGKYAKKLIKMLAIKSDEPEGNNGKS